VKQPRAIREPKADATVLIADDDENLAKEMGNLFAKYKFQVKIAHDLDRTIRLLLSTTFDVVILDVHMPQRKGGTLQADAGLVIGQLMRRLALAGHETVVVLFTGFASVHDCFAATEAGAYYLPKELTTENAVAGMVKECRRLTDERRRRQTTKQAWVDQYFDELVEHFGGKAVAVLGPPLGARSAVRRTTMIGGRRVMTARTEQELRSRIARDEELRRAEPVLLWVPKKERTR
jgi:ActR/RegA family two-component response regulator